MASSMSTYGPMSPGRKHRMMELVDVHDPSAGLSGTPPKSPRPKTRSLSPRTGSALVEGNLGDILQATVRMLSPAQGSTQGPAHGVLGPPARLRGQSPAFDSQMGDAVYIRMLEQPRKKIRSHQDYRSTNC